MSQEVINNILMGLEVTGYGLLGVFGVLVLFYIVVVIMGKIPDRGNEANN